MRWPEGLRAVALLEAGKGALVILAGCGLASLLHADLQVLAERMVAHLHLNPASHYPRLFIDTAAGLGGKSLPLLVAGAIGYALLRFVEAYGLWHGRAWASWFAVLSGAFYIPFELYELATRPGWLALAALLANAAVVALVALSLRRRAQSGRPT